MEHRIFVSGNVAVIEVYHKKTNRYFYTLVDAEDVEFIEDNVFRLSAGLDRYTNYITCRAKRGITSLHRLILNTPKGLVVDHINHNGLDNRKKNIRNVSYSINNRSYNKRDSPGLNPSYLLKKEMERNKWEKIKRG